MDSTVDKVNLRGIVPTKSSCPIRLGGSVLGPRRHICAFFNSHDDEYRVLLPFIKDGLEYGQKAVHIGGILQKNPFFVPPDKFLRELRERRGPVNRRRS